MRESPGNLEGRFLAPLPIQKKCTNPARPEKIKTLASSLLAFCFLALGLGILWQPTRPPAAQAAQVSAPQDTPKDQTQPPRDTQPKQATPGQKDKDGAKKDDKKEAKKEDPNDAPFSKIHVKSGKVVITQTGKQSLEARGNPIFVQNAKTGVEDGTLHLEGFNVEFIVTLKDLSGLTIDGLSTAEIKDLKTKRLEVTVKSGAKVVVAGTADEQVIDVSGIGRFNGEACKGKQAKVKVDGGGQAAVNVSDKLHATVQGVGHVYYLGAPAIEQDVGFGAQLLQGPAPAAGVPGIGGRPGRPDRFGRFAAANRLGVELTKPSDVLCEQLDLPKDQGLVLNNVKAGSAAAKAGLKDNDILLELGGKKVSSQASEFLKTLNDFKTGAKVDAVVLRKGKRETVKDVTLPEVPKDAFAPGFPRRLPNLPNLPNIQLPNIQLPKIQLPNLPNANIGGWPVGLREDYKKIDWQSNMQKAVEKARAENKPILAFLYVNQLGQKGGEC